MNGRILYFDYSEQRIYDATSSIVSFLLTMNFNVIDYIFSFPFLTFLFGLSSL